NALAVRLRPEQAASESGLGEADRSRRQQGCLARLTGSLLPPSPRLAVPRTPLDRPRRVCAGREPTLRARWLRPLPGVLEACVSRGTHCAGPCRPWLPPQRPARRPQSSIRLGVWGLAVPVPPVRSRVLAGARVH